MPNTTVRASARPMPETTNRRAVLGALAAGATASVVVAVPTAATAAALAPDSRDAELLALIGVVREAKARRLAATVAMNEAKRRTPQVPAPDASIRDGAAREARIPADIEWRDARHQARVNSGAWAAVERQEALLGEELDLQKEIPGTPAQTAPGALAKIELVADYHDDPTFGSEDEFLDWETGFRILLSAALDLKRLGGGAMRSTRPPRRTAREPGADA